jgi:hypothetical protein
MQAEVPADRPAGRDRETGRLGESHGSGGHLFDPCMV